MQLVGQTMKMIDDKVEIFDKKLKDITEIREAMYAELKRLKR